MGGAVSQLTLVPCSPCQPSGAEMELLVLSDGRHPCSTWDSLSSYSLIPPTPVPHPTTLVRLTSLFPWVPGHKRAFLYADTVCDLNSLTPQWVCIRLSIPKQGGRERCKPRGWLAGLVLEAGGSLHRYTHTQAHTHLANGKR